MCLVSKTYFITLSRLISLTWSKSSNQSRYKNIHPRTLNWNGGFIALPTFCRTFQTYRESPGVVKCIVRCSLTQPTVVDKATFATVQKINWSSKWCENVKRLTWCRLLLGCIIEWRGFVLQTSPSYISAKKNICSVPHAGKKLVRSRALLAALLPRRCLVSEQQRPNSKLSVVKKKQLYRDLFSVVSHFSWQQVMLSKVSCVSFFLLFCQVYFNQGTSPKVGWRRHCKYSNDLLSCAAKHCTERTNLMY